jgi:hypothetical protein
MMRKGLAPSTPSRCAESTTYRLPPPYPSSRQRFTIG